MIETIKTSECLLECPNCGANWKSLKQEDISFGGDGETLTVSTNCTKCKATWGEHYRITGVTVYTPTTSFGQAHA
jgi:DNA-directed RNA polymerase subunit M/transcription elongation factor TFIIS